MSLTVYKSSAGSGKTFTLVKAYLSIALKNAFGAGIKPILAMTFTNKAAAEMQTRIVQQLHAIASSGKDETPDMMQALLSDHPEYAREELVKRCQWLLHQILHSYSFFSISTIDKFNHGLIRTYSNDLGLTQNFEIELEQDDLLRDAIEKLIARAGTEPVLTDFLIQFSLNRIELDQSWRIEQELFDHCKFILHEDASENLASFSELSLEELAETRKKLNAQVKTFEKRLQTHADQAIELIRNSGLDEASFHQGKRGGLPAYFRRILNGRIGEPIPKYTLDTIEGDKWYSSGKPQDQKNLIEELKPELSQLFFAIKKELDQHLSTYLIRQAVLKNFYATSLIHAVYLEFEELKKERNLLPISDFNKLISQIVSEQDAPFIYERIGNHFAHYLIDEFQDTSKLQWQNILPLLANSLSLDEENLIVGDAKQAIYRWRGGDVEQFVHIPQLDNSASPVLQDHAAFVAQFKQETTLQSNYRSKKHVVEFNNTLFRNISKNSTEYIQTIYAETKQKYLDRNDGGYVEVQVYQDSKDNEESFDEWNVRQVIEAVKQIKALGYDYQDIAVLSRSNGNLVKLVEALRECDEYIPTISSEALLISNSKKVRALVAFLKLSLYPDDHHEQLRVLFLLSQIHQFEDELFPLVKSIIEEKSESHFDFVMKSLGFHLELHQLTSRDEFETVEWGVKALKLHGVSDEYLSAFMNQATQFFIKKDSSLLNFLNYFEERWDKLAISSGEGLNAVQLLTIHKSKGLEFPVVIYPYADFSYRYYGKIWLNLNGEVEGLNRFLVNKNKELDQTRYAPLLQEDREKIELDELNVLYVACTRAVDQLYLFTSNSRKKDLNKVLLPALKDVQGWEGDEVLRYGQQEMKKSSLEDKPVDAERLEFDHMYNYPEGKRFNYILPLEEDHAVGHFSSAEYGTLVHETFAQIFALEDMQPVLQGMRMKFGLNDAIFSKLEEDIRRIVDHDQMQPFFNANEVKTEVEYTNSLGEIIRMDRVVKTDKWTVIDFKTGDEKDEHLSQINQYKQVLKEVYQEEVDAYLIYVESAYLKKV